MEWSLLQSAKNISAPVLLVRGKLTDMVSEVGMASLRRAVPHASFVDVENSGHMVAGDSNDRFTESLLAFLAEVRPRESQLVAARL
jgi:pimeloyl-ACP methyl ester carboxylesterase